MNTQIAYRALTPRLSDKSLLFQQLRQTIHTLSGPRTDKLTCPRPPAGMLMVWPYKSYSMKEGDRIFGCGSELEFEN